VLVRNLRTGKVLGDRVWRTRGGREGARGLLGRQGLTAGEGLWIVGSMGVHSFGMRFPIDVAYLDGELRVVHLIEHMRPNRCGRISLRTETVLELPSGTLAETGTRQGDRLELVAQLSSTANANLSKR
jgi:uncharacterized membrane protein (UPF0127 family)